jgi:cell surface protein SprA
MLALYKQLVEIYYRYSHHNRRFANGGTQARWVLFKIPVANPDNTIGGISDFRSIRFMRMFMTGFTNPVTTFWL